MSLFSCKYMSVCVCGREREREREREYIDIYHLSDLYLSIYLSMYAWCIHTHTQLSPTYTSHVYIHTHTHTHTHTDTHLSRRLLVLRWRNSIARCTPLSSRPGTGKSRAAVAPIYISYMSVCLCVCVCVCLCVCTCIHIYVCSRTYIYLIYVSMSVCVSVCLSLSMCVCVRIYIYMYILRVGLRVGPVATSTASKLTIRSLAEGEGSEPGMAPSIGSGCCLPPTLPAERFS